MEVGTKLHGFTVTRVRALEEIPATLWEMEHDKSGAQLCWLDRTEENMTFSIAFKTLPRDSTGVFHILEHSVLCGSRKYPVKEPFVELLKSSVQTFLNAMTFPDKTVYPVSSRNHQDLLNLMDVYLDAVFHPAIYQRPEIFRQEGWRYEFGDPIVYQGVVLNEMKGAYGSPHTVLEHGMNQLLFPDTCYRHESGGNPAHIPDLTYQQFLASHKTYYHPSNARISLVGSVNLEAVLEKLDSFLRDFERRDISFEIPLQKPVAAVREEIPYEIGPEEPLEKRTIFCCGTLLGTFEDQVRNEAVSILADYLAGDNDAPLKRALLDAGLGQDVAVGVHDGIQQSWLSWEVWNTDRENVPAIESVIRKTLEKLTAEGLDPQRLEACYNHFAFQMRDRDNTGTPRSLSEAVSMLDGWLYGGDPAQGLLVEDTLATLAAQLKTNYFVQLIRELFLENTHCATVLLVPSRTLGEEKREREASRIQGETGSWTPAQRAEFEAQAQALDRWQKTPDSPQAMAAIPMLKLSDLKERPERLPMKVEKWGNTTLLRHEIGSSLWYLHAYFDASDCPLEELPALTALTTVLGTMGTERRGSQELQMLIKQKIGSLRFRPVVISGRDWNRCRVFVTVQMACLEEQASSAAELITEILTKTSFTDRRMLRELVNQSALEAQMALTSSGHQYALTRVGAYESAGGVAREYLGGIQHALWLKQFSDSEDSQLDALLETMKTLARRIFTQERVTLSCSERVTDRLLDSLKFPQEGERPEESSYEPLGSRQEGLLIPAAVSFVGQGANFKRYDHEFHGSLMVLANLLNYIYLWNEIRVQGGAYGCGFLARDDGEIGFYTYRDPQPGRSLDVIRQAGDFIRSDCQQLSTLTGFILSSVSSLDPLLNGEGKMTVGETRYLKGTTYEDICRYYSQLLHTTSEDLLKLCQMLKELKEENAICVVGGQNQLDSCGDRLTSRNSVSQF